MKLNQVWKTPNELKQALKNSYAKDCLSDENAEVLSNLLFAKYANSRISNSSVEQFKLKMWSVVFRYGPSWEAKLKIQDQVRSINDEDLEKGDTIISSSYDPNGQFGCSENEIYGDNLRSQSASVSKLSKLKALSQKWTMIESDVTTAFINAFKECFTTVVIFGCPDYEEEGEE